MNNIAISFLDVYCSYGAYLILFNLSRSTLFFILFPNKIISLLLFPLSNSNIEQYCQESVKKAAKKSEPGVQYSIIYPVYIR